jgi:hypothetical protein
MNDDLTLLFAIIKIQCKSLKYGGDIKFIFDTIKDNKKS